MNTNKIKITLDLLGVYTDIIPEISISIDDSMIRRRRLDQTDLCVINIDLEPGHHKLSIDFNDHEALAQDPNIGVVIKSLKFQNLSDEFNVYSSYRPIYPNNWIKENLVQGRVLNPVIHSNYLGWCGQWWIDFETPIYSWIHQKLNLGWLLDSNIDHACHEHRNFSV